MFTRSQSPIKPSKLEEEIDRLISQMSKHDGYTKEYAEMVKNVKVLCEADNVQKGANRPNGVNSETILTVAGNLVGIFAILGYERANVITSKALSFVMKPRITT